MTNYRYTLDIQFFSCEGSGSEFGETGENENTVAGQNGAELQANKENEKDLDNDEFSQLIKGKYKEQFARKAQGIIDKRFKLTKELEAYKEKVSPLVDSLMEKYGLEEGSEEKLFDILNSENEDLEENNEEAFEENDDSHYEERALNDENETDENESEHKRTDALREKIAQWIMASKEFQKDNPDFDLRGEIRENPLFSKLLLSGVDLKTAYSTVHRDEILSGAVTYTADRVKKQVVQSIEAKGKRPMENGISSQGAIVTSVDVNSLTSQDILKILKQVERGANIKF